MYPTAALADEILLNYIYRLFIAILNGGLDISGYISRTTATASPLYVESSNGISCHAF